MTDWSGYIGLILQGALVTLELTALGSVLALVMAFVAGLGFVGYVAIRILGPGRGLGVTGLLGGLVSSTAVTISLSGRARAHPALARSCALA